MRPLRSVLAVAVLSLLLFPARADAYIWAWLDDLSGPWFAGAVVEWRVYCRTESIADAQKALMARRSVYADRLRTYQKALEGANERSRPYYRNAASYINAAIVFVDYAIATLDRDPNADVSRLLAEASIWQNYARLNADYADHLQRGTAPVPQVPDTPELPGQDERQLRALVIPGIGVTFSLCETRPGRKPTQFLSINTGYAWDLKRSNRDFQHRMVTVGASYNLIVSPSIVLGAGAGVATFTSRDGDAFHKLYVQPMIVDFRPFLLSERRQTGSPWNHVLYLRGSILTFPTGFEPGRFGNQTERYEAELTPTFGIHFDFSPIIQRAQGKWRPRQPEAVPDPR